MSKSVPLFIEAVRAANQGGTEDPVSGSTVYDWFLAWCEANQVKSTKYGNMNKHLRKHGIKIERSMHGNYVSLLNHRVFRIDTSDKWCIMGTPNAKYYSHAEKVEWWKKRLTGNGK